MSDKQTFIDIDSTSNQGSTFDFQNFSVSDESPIFIDKKNASVEGEQSSKKYSIWSLEYFQQFFDVDTNTVVDRILASMYPKRGTNYLQYNIESKPDLYGPFWICVTLVFTVAISGNVANYFQAVADSRTYHWKYDFHTVSVSASLIFLYAWFIPSILWVILKYQGSEHFSLPLLDLICVYGYSLSVYVPISILWVIQISLVQWILVFVGAALSGYVLMTSISPAFGEKNFVLLSVFLALHVLLALSFMLYFFHK